MTMPLTIEDIHAIAARAAEAVLAGNLPPPPEYTALVNELRELREKRHQLTQALTEHQRREDQALDEFKRKNPDIAFPGSPEWVKLRDESKEITRPLAALEERIAAVSKQIDAMFPDSESEEQEEEEEDEEPAERAAEPACPNLQPMAEWIKGDEPGTCRPCVLAPVIQWYYQELKGQGYEDLASQLEAEADVLEEDNAELIMAICKDLDTIKAAVPEELRKRLEEFDCHLQVQDLDEIAAEIQRAG